MAAAALLASSAMLRRLVFTSMMLLLQQYAQAEDCCAKCLNNVPDFVYNSMDFKQCIAQNYCCFHCFEKDIGSPTVLPVAGTVFNGPTTTATTGSFLQIKWDKADQVTFVSFAPNQAKSGIPVLASSQAIKKDGSIFLICPQYAGMLYFRGFGTDTCNSVSVEYPITVISGIDGSTCGGPGPSPPTPGTATSGAPTLPNAAVTCNLARGSVIDGVCVCASDWIGPPECVGTPIWKWLVTVGGGVAAMCSIAVSIRAFLMNRKAKKKLNDAAAADPTSPTKGTAVVVEMESMRMQTPERRESTQPDDVPYIQRESGDQDPSSTGVAVPPSPRSKEYTI